jgi:hypothetical protein
MNVVNFPICRVANGRHWYGGRAFETKQEVIDSMSDRDWRRIVQPVTQPAFQGKRRSRHEHLRLSLYPACPTRNTRAAATPPARRHRSPRANASPSYKACGHVVHVGKSGT